MPSLISHPVRRQINTNPNSPDYCVSYWYCDQTVFIIKWAVVGAVVVIVLAFILGGYFHAKRRMSRGLPPLRYHRWLVSRRDRERFWPPAQNSYGFYRSNAPPGHGEAQIYPMNDYGYPPPPPAYNEGESVPVYTPPSKVNPDQSYAAPTGAGGSHAPGPSMPARAAGSY